MSEETEVAEPVAVTEEVDFPKRVELPRGNWVELRDPYEVSERERRPLKRFFLAKGKSKDERGGDVIATPRAPQLGGVPVEDEDTDEKLEMLESYERELMLFFATSWSFTQEITHGGLQDLPGYAYAAIDNAVGPRIEILFPNLSKKDPENPTTP